MVYADSSQKTAALIIDQLLQQAIEYHQAGQLQNVERLYRVVLQIQPDHSDAQYNLTLIAGQAEDALQVTQASDTPETTQLSEPDIQTRFDDIDIVKQPKAKTTIAKKKTAEKPKCISRFNSKRKPPSQNSIEQLSVVFDTFVEDVPADVFNNRPWHPGKSPKSAVHEYLKTHSEFEIDKSIQNKLIITLVPDGYLKRISQ